MAEKIRLAIFASGNGTNAEAIMEYFSKDEAIAVAVVLTNNPSAGVLERARRFGIHAEVFNRKQFYETDEVLATLARFRITHIVLAGFLWLVEKRILAAYPNRILNIHPALLPKFGGKGMYGEKVHQAVITASEQETGITIHEVNDKFDEGKILFQATCPVEPHDTAVTIAAKVHSLEHAHFPKVIRQWALGLGTR
jgi:phosphoribosylglycinamide formyltransferase-1